MAWMPEKFFSWVGSIRTRIVLVFLALLVAGGLATTSIGSWMVSSTILEQAQRKVSHDMATAWMIYNNRLLELKHAVSQAGDSIRVNGCPPEAVKKQTKDLLERLKVQFRMDFLTLTDCRGDVLVRSSSGGMEGGNAAGLAVVEKALQGETVFSTEIFSKETLAAESAGLAERALIGFIPTPNARPRKDGFIDSGMVLVAASPVYDGHGKVAGALYGGVLLNRNYEIVDKLKALVYGGEKFKGQDTGTGTIFIQDVRIATNVTMPNGKRAVGTRLSAEVARKVLDHGGHWQGEAFVVKDWYLTSYDPIHDLSGRVIGILYVGVLKAPYVAVRDRVIFTFFIIASLCLVLVILGSHFLTSGIIRPLGKLASATERIAGGDLDVEVLYESPDEIGRLSTSFNKMTVSLRDMQEQWEARLQDRLVQSEKLASLGKMAAGVAHEMNSPLTGIMTFSHLLRRRSQDRPEEKEWLDTIVSETERCARIVRQLLDFAREIRPDMTPAKINDLVGETLDLVRYQSIFHDIEVALELDNALGFSLMDSNQIKQAMLNIILNAVDAMEGRGKLAISTKLRGAEGMKGEGEKGAGDLIELRISDTGCGIHPEDVCRIFDPFFTTKDVGQGTGLGLAVTYGIIKHHGGDIQVESTLGEGTTFMITIPILHPESKDVEPAQG
jgi:two-component system NtrC family sensor kinase